MAFFHANPSGRILNKFSADQGQIDELLPTVLFDFLQSAAIVLGAVVLVLAAIPWLLLLLVPVLWLFLEEPLRSGGLEAEVSEGGGNLSVGQRQLLSLARAVLRGSRVFITDEATANVDFETDTLVQRMLRESDAFRGRTVVQIAHRMHTIIDSDLLLVLDNGCVAEAGAPAELLRQPGSMFAGMVEQTGSAAELRARAQQAEQRARKMV
eukprot:g4845.t1